MRFGGKEKKIKSNLQKSDTKAQELARIVVPVHPSFSPIYFFFQLYPLLSRKVGGAFIPPPHGLDDIIDH